MERRKGLKNENYFGKINRWRIRVYDQHIGIVDGDGCTVLSMSGKRGDKRVWELAELIVSAVNEELSKRESKGEK